jgi:hypothetical protein
MTKGFSSWRVGRLAAAGILAVLFFLLCVGEAPAQAAKRRVGVTLNGPHASAVHDGVAVALKHHGFETTSTDLAGDSQDAIASAAKQGKLAAVIVGEVRDGGKRLKLRVYGAAGDLIGEGSWSEAAGIKKLVAVVERTLWARVGGSLSKARAGGGDKADKSDKGDKADEGEAEEAAPAGAAEKTPTYSRSKDSDTSAAPEESESPRKRKKKHGASSDDAEASEGASHEAGAAGTALDLAVGPRFMSRSLAWSPATPMLRGYSLGFAPSVGALFAWYPAAHFMGGWASNVGLAASIEYTPGLVSEASGGARYPTSESDYWAGARGRLIFGSVQASLTLGGGQQTFIFHSSGTANRADLASLPDVKYTYARVGVDVRIALPANLALMLGAGYRYVLGAGDQNYLIQTTMYFPNSKFLAFDATAAVGYKFLSMLEARAGFDLRRYQMTAGTNTYMVNSGTDQYLGLWLQIAVLLDGVAAGEGGPATSPKAAKSAADEDEDSSETPPPGKKKKGSDDEE